MPVCKRCSFITPPLQQSHDIAMTISWLVARGLHSAEVASTRTWVQQRPCSFQQELLSEPEPVLRSTTRWPNLLDVAIGTGRISPAAFHNANLQFFASAPPCWRHGRPL